MRISVVTLFPEFFDSPLRAGILHRAREAKLVEFEFANPRDFTTDRHRTVDDYPYGGGPGMVLRPEPFVDAIESTQKKYKRFPALKTRCAYVYQTYLGAGAKRRVGDRQQQPKLVKLLQSIAANGPDFFYDGPLGHALANTISIQGGVLSAQDLNAYKVKYRKPLTWTFGQYEVISMPSPSSKQAYSPSLK